MYPRWSAFFHEDTVRRLFGEQAAKRYRAAHGLPPRKDFKRVSVWYRPRRNLLRIVVYKSSKKVDRLYADITVEDPSKVFEVFPELNAGPMQVAFPSEKRDGRFFPYYLIASYSVGEAFSRLMELAKTLGEEIEEQVASFFVGELSKYAHLKELFVVKGKELRVFRVPRELVPVLKEMFKKEIDASKLEGLVEKSTELGRETSDVCVCEDLKELVRAFSGDELMLAELSEVVPEAFDDLERSYYLALGSAKKGMDICYTVCKVLKNIKPHAKGSTTLAVVKVADCLAVMKVYKDVVPHLKKVVPVICREYMGNENSIFLLKACICLGKPERIPEHDIDWILRHPGRYSIEYIYDRVKSCKCRVHVLKEDDSSVWVKSFQEVISEIKNGKIKGELREIFSDFFASFVNEVFS